MIKKKKKRVEYIHLMFVNHSPHMTLEYHVTLGTLVSIPRKHVYKKRGVSLGYCHVHPALGDHRVHFAANN